MKNKFLFIISIFLFIVGIFTFSFCASENDIHTVETRFGELKMNSACFSHKYKIAFLSNDNGDSGTVTLIVSDSPIIFDFLTVDSSTFNSVRVTSSTGLNFGTMNVPRDTFECEPLEDLKTYDLNYYYYGEPEFLYASYDVYNSSDELVFLGAPLQNLEVVEPMKMKQVEEIPHQAVEVVEIVLPTVLTMMGVLLIVYLVRYKIFSNL